MLRLRAGARIVYKLVDRVDERVSGHGTWWDMHTALTVREEEFLPNYRRMWGGIPEEDGYKADLNLTVHEQEDSSSADRFASQPCWAQVETDL